MADVTGDPKASRPWWLALAALAICAPWPGWSPGPVALAAVVGLLVLLARPAGRQRWAWLAVVVALGGAIAPPGEAPDRRRLSASFDRHCRGMLATAGMVVGDESLTRLFAATGEVLDPTRPFALLERVAGAAGDRTVYLADDRGRLLAWGGAVRSFPAGLRALGPRVWGVEWSAARGVLYLREPIIIEGRIVGSVTVADGAGLRGASAWGMRAPWGSILVLGRGSPDTMSVAAATAPGIEVEVGLLRGGTEARPWPFIIGWLMLALGALIAAPTVGGVVVAVGLVSAALSAHGLSGAELAAGMLLGSAAVGRLGRELRPMWARSLVAVTLIGVVIGRLWWLGEGVGPWLPNHLLRPGWGGVWMVVLAWIAIGWPTMARGRMSLAARVAVATGLALLGLSVDLARYPLQIVGFGARTPSRVVLPRAAVAVDELLPDGPSRCRLDDLAPVLAHRWGLDRWSTPSRLTLVSPDGAAVSSWGDLSPAGDRQRLARVWPLTDDDGSRLELDVATEPWGWLDDWRSGVALEEAWKQPIWYAVLTRSGSVAATLHPEIRDLDPAIAGEAYHSGAVWTRIGVGDGRAMARILRRGDWLIAAVVHPPAPSVWAIQTALAVLWSLLGLMLARPLVLRRGQFATFGGRLRLLVAGGVVIPLVILTLFLQLRLGREEARLEEVLGRDALDAARYTIEHLGGGVVIDDEFAAWLARGWGGEVAFFDGTTAIAVSRPDLLSVGALPQLPTVEAFPAYLLGRDDAVVVRRPEWVASAGAVVVEGSRLLLHLYRTDPLRTGEAPDAVDWLLTGALLAALIALIATARIEDRLSVSLRDLVDLARRLVRGEPVGPVRRPRETDLAEVLDAVRSMNEEVRRRELSLRHQEELLRITLANLASAVMVLGPDGDLTFANPSAEALVAEHGGLVFDRVRRLASGISGDAGAEETIQPLPGSDLTWRLGVAQVPLPDGRGGVVAVIDDVTEIVRVDRLQQLTQLARIVAHEVKNPLTPIRLWIQEIEEARRRGEPDLDRLLEESCREIAGQVERLKSTATSFSNLVALEQWVPEEVDLAAAVGALSDGLGVLERRGILIRGTLPPRGEAMVTADRQWLQRALANLLQNSIDVLGDGTGEIRLAVACEPGEVVFEIEDSGGGVPPDQLQDLFAPHFSTTASGSGLGLALVHQVVIRCQGRVEAANGPTGLRIRIVLPAKPHDEP